MRKLKNIYKTIAVLLLIAACTDNELRDLSFLDSMAPPTNLEMLYSITQDNTGAVTITPNAIGATSFDVYFGDGTTEPSTIPAGQSVAHVYEEGTYNVALVAHNSKGNATDYVKPIVVSFRAPENLTTSIENDAVNSKQVNVNATADFAMMYEFYSGETGVTQPVATANIGEAFSYQYAEPGTYTVKIIVKGGAIETTTHTEEFEVTEILAPLVTAPTPPEKNGVDVVSIFSDAYTDVTLSELPTGWSASGFEATTVEGDNVWKLTNLDFIGFVTNYATGIDLGAMEKMHIDYWVPEAVTNGLSVKIVNTVDGGEDVESLGTTVTGSWQSVEIDMVNFDGNLANKNKITQILIDSDGPAGVVYIDNFYFYKEPSSPVAAAVTPEARFASDVVSIFSDAYTDVTLNELPTGWSASGFEATTVDGNNIWKLPNLDFLGMVTNYGSGIDLGSMEMMHIDYWVPDGVTNELFVKIVNTVSGGEDIESLGTTVAGSWQSIDVDMANFDGNLANKNEITQIIIDSDGIAGSVYIDNFYFYRQSATAPTVGALEPPTNDAADVISIFSDAYTNVTLNEIPTAWSASGFEATTIGSDNVWKFTNIDFVGMVTNYASGINVSDMDKMHIDYWVPFGTTNELLVKIVNTVVSQEAVQSLGTTAGGEWKSIELDMADFDLADKNNITQILIDSDGVAPTVYVDNFYFYKE